MAKRYLEINIEGPGFCDDTIYVPLVDGKAYTETTLEWAAQEAVDYVRSWDYRVVSEADVPEGER